MVRKLAFGVVGVCALTMFLCGCDELTGGGGGGGTSGDNSICIVLWGDYNSRPFLEVVLPSGRVVGKGSPEYNSGDCRSGNYGSMGASDTISWDRAPEEGTYKVRFNNGCSSVFNRDGNILFPGGGSYCDEEATWYTFWVRYGD